MNGKRAHRSVEDRRLCEAEAEGSNPPESTFNAPGDASPQGRAEGQVNDLKRPCKGNAHRASNGFSGTLEPCLSVDGSVRVPKKGVPSCDKLRGEARNLRSGDALMGHPNISVLIRKDRERPELKHLSRGRRRNQSRCRE